MMKVNFFLTLSLATLIGMACTSTKELSRSKATELIERTETFQNMTTVRLTEEGSMEAIMDFSDNGWDDSIFKSTPLNTLEPSNPFTVEPLNVYLGELQNSVRAKVIEITGITQVVLPNQAGLMEAHFTWDYVD